MREIPVSEDDKENYLPEVWYTISVHTADISGGLFGFFYFKYFQNEFFFNFFHFYCNDIAGTNANVKLQLYGDKGKSDTMSLDSSKNNFERGSIDKFSHVGVDLGKLLKVNHIF